MFRYVVPAVIFLASPAFAGDEILQQIFDADGPTITHGQTINDDQSDDSTSSEPEIVTDADCPADRWGSCPELLTPEELAEWQLAQDLPQTLPPGGDWSLFDPTVNPDGSAKDDASSSSDEPEPPHQE